jgi:hypothetical protein
VSAEFEKALAAHRAGDYAAAEQGYLPFRHFKNAAQNLASLYNETDRHAEAEAILREVVQNFPDFSPSRHSLSLARLAQRRYAEGWPPYEARRAVTRTPDPAAAYPEWRGEPLAGRRLVVVAEQGIGDVLMFGRDLPRLAAAGAEVVVACDRENVAPLFRAAGWTTVAYQPGGALPEADHWVFFGSLPLRLGAGPPSAPAYLQQLGQGSGGGVGVVATGSPTHQYDRFRSMPPDAAAELRRLGRDLSPGATGARSLLETARIVAGLDLVIAVDTSIVHLAGAMGKPCWVLLARYGVDFRWNDGVQSDWYPALRLFRQQAPGDWAGVLEQVRRALAEEGIST